MGHRRSPIVGRSPSPPAPIRAPPPPVLGSWCARYAEVARCCCLFPKWRLCRRRAMPIPGVPSRAGARGRAACTRACRQRGACAKQLSARRCGPCDVARAKIWPRSRFPQPTNPTQRPRSEADLSKRVRRVWPKGRHAQSRCRQNAQQKPPARPSGPRQELRPSAPEEAAEGDGQQASTRHRTAYKAIMMLLVAAMPSTLVLGTWVDLPVARFTTLPPPSPPAPRSPPRRPTEGGK